MTSTIELSARAGHGTRRGYQLGCRCLPCAVKESRYQQLWREFGPTRIPVDLVLEHVDDLIASGWRGTELNAAAGLSSSTIHYWRTEASAVNRDQALAVKAVLPKRVPPSSVPKDVDRALDEVSRRTGTSRWLVLHGTHGRAHPHANFARAQFARVLLASGRDRDDVAAVMGCRPAHIRRLTRKYRPEPWTVTVGRGLPKRPSTEAWWDVCTVNGCDVDTLAGGRWCVDHFNDKSVKAAA